MNMQFDIYEKVEKQAAHIINQSDIEANDYVNDSMVAYSEHQSHLRSGGAMFMIPNPQLYTISDEECTKAVSILEKTSKELAIVNPSLDFGIGDIVAFVKQRLLFDSDADRKTFSDNLYNDLEKM